MSDNPYQPPIEPYLNHYCPWASRERLHEQFRCGGWPEIRRLAAMTQEQIAAAQAIITQLDGGVIFAPAPAVANTVALPTGFTSVNALDLMGQPPFGRQPRRSGDE